MRKNHKALHMKTIKSVTWFALLLCALQTFGQLQSGENVIISERINQDLYVAGGTVTINAPIDGDLIIAGGTVTINDSVSQDILLGGGTAFLNGYAGDDIRCAGGKIIISGSVAGDVIATAGTLDILEGVVIRGNLIASGGEVTQDGDVGGLIKIASGTFTLNGKSGNNMECRGGKIIINGTVEGGSLLAANVIELGPEARFSRDVKYWSNDGSIDFGNSMSGGNATFDPSLEINNGSWQYLGFASFLMVMWYLGTALLMIALIQYLFRNTLRKSADTVKNLSLKSLGLGFLFLVGVPAAIVVVALTILAIPVAILLLIGYITIILLGTIIVAVMIAHWINNTYYQSQWSSVRIVLTSFGIFVFLKLASLTPVIGPLIMLLLACMAFGGILQQVRFKRSAVVASI